MRPEATTERPLTVTELTQGIKRLLENAVGEVEVAGEIGNFTRSSRGHCYFTLKDRDATLSCVLFKGASERLSVDPEEGMAVIAEGRLSVYAARGQYQLIVQHLRETGQGALFQQFLKLKEKLEREGLFDAERKKELPLFPNRVAVVTSPSGAALRDIIHVIRRRFSSLELFISPALVQGKLAAGSLLEALERVRRYHEQCLQQGRDGIDLVLLARGGGSLEDLWAFNDESLARSIAAFPLPVISGVGHETDFTIADFVADERAPTPSAAAEMAVREIAALAEEVRRLKAALARTLLDMVEKRRLRLERLQHSWGLRQPLDLVRQAMQQLDDYSARSLRVLEEKARERRNRLDNLNARMAALNPEAVLERGYSIVTRARDGRVVRKESQAKVGEHLHVRLASGELRAVTMPRGEDFLEGLVEADASLPTKSS